MTRTVFLASAIVAGLALSACNVVEQDGDGSDKRQGLNGLAVDGRVAGGKVWVDMNENNKVDDFEPHAYTDSDGYYSYNPLTNTNYCDLPVVSDEYKRYCLNFSGSAPRVVIRIKGGIDLSTGEKLKGTMLMRTEWDSLTGLDSNPLIISPITTLLGSTSSSNHSSLYSGLGITEGDLRLDFSQGQDAKSKRLYANAVSIQTMLAIVGDSTQEEKSNTNTVDDIAKVISDSIIDTNKPPIELPDSALQAIVGLSSLGSLERDGLAGRLGSLNTEIAKFSDAGSNSELKNNVKAVEVLAKLIDEETHGENKDSATKVLGLGLDILAITLNTNLQSAEEVDVPSISKSLVDAGKKAILENRPVDPIEIDTAVDDAKLSSDTAWGGNWFVLEATAENSEDLSAGSYVAVYLNGTSESKSGSIAVCVNASAVDSTSSEDKLINEYLNGRWTKVSEGVVSLVLNYEGQEFEGVMKAKAKTTDTDAQRYRFSTDIDGATEEGDVILNANGVAALANVSLPASSEDCENKIDVLL